MQQSYMRKTFETWEEAFRGLCPVVRQQSVRIAGYTQAIFLEACAAGFGLHQSGGSERMQSTYAELAYKCGMYHQLGKALVPEEYQIYSEAFSLEEKQLYRKYTQAGRMLVAELQEASNGNKRYKGEGEPPTQNIPWLMIRESCQQHMERFDGTGYPRDSLKMILAPSPKQLALQKSLTTFRPKSNRKILFLKHLMPFQSKAARHFRLNCVQYLNLHVLKFKVFLINTFITQ